MLVEIPTVVSLGLPRKVGYKDLYLPIEKLQGYLIEY